MIIDWQRKTILEKFTKLSKKFLTPEQRSIIFLGEESEDYWLLRNEGCSGGVTKFNWTVNEDGSLKLNSMGVYIRLFPANQELRTLLDAIAHEFAHVYLIFKGIYGHNPTHSWWMNSFFRFLMKDYLSI